jgi:pimeloyl-ACP methyl ester carboxylesterase
MMPMPTPTLVVLPGLDGTGRRLSDFVAALGSDIDVRIVAYPPDRPLGYLDLESLVRLALPQDRPFVLLGESFGGPLAIRIGASPPPGLIGIVLCSSFARYPLALGRLLSPFIARIPMKSLPRWLRAPLLWGSMQASGAPAAAERASAGVSAVVLRHRIEALLAVDERAALRRIRLPMLLIRARRDRVVPDAACRQILALAAHARVLEIDGPHLLLQTLPQGCAAPVLEFMRAAAGATAAASAAVRQA